jgi:type IV pilus assembly protein PilW
MEPNSRRSPFSQAGFTLVEIMVGLGIGMLATVVIIQVISVFEAQRRTTTGTADAQTNGAIALYNIARELQTAGYPLIPVAASPLECTALTVNGIADATTPNRLSPVAIADGVAATGVSASDAITIRYGASLMGGVPTQINAGLTGNVAPVVSNLGCQAGDITLITNGTNCYMSSATAVTGTTVGTMTVTLADTSGATSSLNLACLGTWHEVTYRVNGGNLERCDLPIATATGGNCNLVIPNVNFVPVVAGIVNLQMQYGVSATANSNQVIQWVDASGTWSAPTVTVANRNRIKGVRIAVVARNANMEAAAVTAACSSTTLAAPTGLCAWDATSALPSPVVAPFVASPAPAIDLSAGDPNWLRYRYRVFDTIIQLRNVVWAKDTLL